MKAIAISLMLTTLLVGGVSTAGAASKKSGDKYYVDVQGHLASLTGPISATVTFSAPVQVGKVRLEPGTYLFSQVATSTFRVTSEDRKKVFVTFTTIPATRSRDERRAQMRFEHVGAGEPAKLLALYPEDSRDGYQIAASKTSKPVATSGTRPPKPVDDAKPVNP